MSKERSIRRILVALDASPCSLAALEVAARLAVALRAELHGLYVEDETFLRGGDLGIASAVGSFSGTVRKVDRPELERHLRTQAAKAKHALESMAAQARLSWSFRVARGAVSAQLLEAAESVDLISLGRSGWSLIESRRIGSTTQAVLSRTDTPVLLLRPGLRMGQAVVAVYDGSDAARAGVVLATEIAHDQATPLTIVLPASGEAADTLRLSVQSQLDGLGLARSVHFRTLIRRDAAVLGDMVRGEDAGVLLLPASTVFELGLQELLTHMDCPVLVVRR